MLFGFRQRLKRRGRIRILLGRNRRASRPSKSRCRGGVVEKRFLEIVARRLSANFRPHVRRRTSLRLCRREDVVDQEDVDRENIVEKRFFEIVARPLSV